MNSASYEQRNNRGRSGAHLVFIKIPTVEKHLHQTYTYVVNEKPNQINDISFREDFDIVVFVQNIICSFLKQNNYTYIVHSFHETPTVDNP